VQAAREVKLSVPLVVRMKGTNEDLGKKILKDSGLPIISADNMADAAKKVVAAVKRKAARKNTAKKNTAKKNTARKKTAKRKAKKKAKKK
jgi:acyl-CoA synthetase (NDP forming)